MSAGGAPELVAAVSRRTDEVVDALRVMHDDALLAPSALPGWSRLTIACHLRYGAEALTRMTTGALAGLPVAYYPGGRDQQRPATLRPAPAEAPSDVVASLGQRSGELRTLWSGLTEEQWRLDVLEPEDRSDLGALQLARLPMLRLTEVEVHGTDLDIGLDEWSDTFVGRALPFRLDWLNTRRTNHRCFDADVSGSWLLVANDGPTYLVSVDGATVTSRPADPASPATAVIEAASRDLLALLLGRPLHRSPRYRGDESFARAFSSAFPGP